MLSGREPHRFDQQPVDACATIAACLAGNSVDPAPFWHDEAARAFAWFGGANDLGVALVDTATGSCRDGLHRDRPNENRGAESLLSYLLSLADMHRLGTRPIGSVPIRLDQAAAVAGRADAMIDVTAA